MHFNRFAESNLILGRLYCIVLNLMSVSNLCLFLICCKQNLFRIYNMLYFSKIDLFAFLEFAFLEFLFIFFLLIYLLLSCKPLLKWQKNLKDFYIIKFFLSLHIYSVFFMTILTTLTVSFSWVKFVRMEKICKWQKN